MAANDIEVSEQVPASRKLQASDAAELLTSISRLVVAKGKNVSEFSVSAGPTDEAVQAMLGPTGNLRAPTARVGKTMVVGFNEDVYDGLFN